MLIVAVSTGLYDWDLSLKARTDGTFGLEGLKYGSPRDYDGATPAAPGNPEASAGQSNAAVATSNGAPVSFVCNTFL